MNFVDDDVDNNDADYGNDDENDDDDEDGADNNNVKDEDGTTTTVAMTIFAVLFEITICFSRAIYTIVHYFMSALTQLFIYN